jgi:hypothetical protein
VFAHKKPISAEYRKSFSTPLGKISLGYVALMGLIALFIPADILKAYPWAATFSDFMAGWIPQIDRLANLGIQPEVNRFYYSVLWAASPGLLILSVLKISEDLKVGLGSALIMPLLKLTPFIVVFCGVIFASQYGYWMTDTSNGFLRFIVGNRLGRAFWGNIMFVAGPTLFVGGVIAIAHGRLNGPIPARAQRLMEGNDS